MKKGAMNVVIGGQAGSESKGKLAAYLALRHHPEVVSMTASPNAGHTFVSDSGEKLVSYHLPISGVVASRSYGALIVLGPASLINPVTFRAEVERLNVDPGDILIDPHATIITGECLEAECGGTYSDIGSTLQGVGEARCRKAARGHKGRIQFAKDNPILQEMGVRFRHSSPLLDDIMRDGDAVLHEMTQGFDLDLEHGISPAQHTTSKMINTAMGLAEMGVSPQMLGEVYGVIRPYPIRVNNRTGYSGSYADGVEIDWETVRKRCGAPAPGPGEQPFGEMTTTTHLLRRVFEFSDERFEAFVRICGPTQICLQFANYLDWSVYGAGQVNGGMVLETPAVSGFVRRLEEKFGVQVRYIGTGPRNDMMVRVSPLSLP